MSDFGRLVQLVQKQFSSSPSLGSNKGAPSKILLIITGSNNRDDVAKLDEAISNSLLKVEGVKILLITIGGGDDESGALKRGDYAGIVDNDQSLFIVDDKDSKNALIGIKDDVTNQLLTPPGNL